MDDTSTDLYAVLGVAREASLEELKRSYKLLALKYHPDKNPGDTAAAAAFKRLSSAYNVLADPAKRKFYDAHGTTDDIDVSAEEWMSGFVEIMQQLTGGVPIKEMLAGMTPADIRRMPPFPFPSELFPPGTFPEGLRFSSEALEGVPPSIAALLEAGDAAALARMFAESSADLANGVDFFTGWRSAGRRRNGAGAPARPRRPGGGAHAGRGASGGGGADARAALAALRGAAPEELQVLLGDLGAGGGDAESLQLLEALLTQLPDAAESSDASATSSAWESASDASGASAEGRGLDEHDLEARSARQGCEAALNRAANSAESNDCGEARSGGREAQARGVSAPGEQRRGSAGAASAATARAWATAAKVGDVDTLRALLAADASLLGSSGPGVGHTALHWASARGQAAAMTWLLAQPGADVNAANAARSTPLHAAAANGQMDAVEVLLGHNAAVDVINLDGHCAAAVARQHGHVDVADRLERHVPHAASSLPPEPQRPPHNADSAVASASHSAGSQRDHEAAVPMRPPDANLSSPPAASSPRHDAPRPPEAAASEPTASEPATNGAPGAVQSIGLAGQLASRDWAKCVAREEGRLWMEAAKAGDLAAMRRLLAHNPYLLLYRGQGTKFSFTGHTALHWCAAGGFVEAARWLLRSGLPADTPNFAGATALHSAVNNRRGEAAAALVLEGGADALRADDLGDSPRDAAVAAQAAPLIKTLDLCTKVRQMRAGGSETWTVRDMKAVLAAADRLVDGAAYLSELRQSCVEYLASLPPPIPPSDLTAHLPPSTDGGAAAAAAAATGEGASAGGVDESAAVGGGDGSDDEAAATLRVVQRAAAAKARGNELFRAGDFSRAALQYSLALRLKPRDATLLSNRSAAHAKLARWDAALADADAALALDPANAKLWCRKGAALVGMGQAGEGIKAYKKAGEADPGYDGARQGLLLAKEAIRAAGVRYQEMWGKAG